MVPRTMLLRYAGLLLLLLAPNAVGSHTKIAAPARASANDNRTSAGVLRGGVLTIGLVAQQAAWYPEAEDGPFKVVEAFGEPGAAPHIPAPLMRVPLGTTIDATITNTLADTLVVLGLPGRYDTLRIASNASRKVRFTPRAVGSFLYAGSIKDTGEFRFGGTHGQLVGALIVDPAGTATGTTSGTAAGAATRDRIFIATSWDPVPIAGNPYFLAMNGKSWPYTEKFVHTVGDTVRWRVLNAAEGSGAHHPMHLHGFYFRIGARGGWDSDTLYGAAQKRWVVTENLPGLASMSITWVPSRAGNWLFHCHNADHIAGRHRHVIAGTERPYPPAPVHDAKEHMEWDMAGLAHAIVVMPRKGALVPAGTGAAATGGATIKPPAPRRLRLLIQARAQHYGNGPGFGYVLQDGANEPAPDSIMIPGSALILRRDEPVEITVVNRLPVHTGVHWHGIELESFYDGVAGWSGFGDRVAPMIAPRDSFIVRFTPPRAGTFIYHAHVTDHVQLARGLYGALLVRAPDRPRVPDADHVMIIGFGRPDGKASLLLNGSNAPAPIARRRDGTQRIRIINISPENNAIVTLSADAVPVTWKAVAKDGFDLPAAQRRIQPARMQIFPGETYDFEFESSAPLIRVRVKNPSTSAGVDDISLELRVRR